MSEVIQLAIVDDEVLITQLLFEYFNSQPDFEVLFSINDGEEFLAQLATSDRLPDVVLLDLKMNGIDGVETARLVKENYPSVKVIIVSSYYQELFIGFMLRNGVDAFLPKGTPPAELTRIIKTVHTTGHYFTPEHIETMRSQISGSAPKPSLGLTPLTSREKEVLEGICRQQTGKEIGAKLFITPRTVEGHKNNLLIKTGARNNAGLVIYAIQNGLFDPHDMMF